MMTHEYIEEHQIVDRYVMNRLSPDEREAFEDLMMTDPDLMDRVELSTAFRRDLERNAVRELEKGIAIGLLARLFGARSMRITTALLAAALFLVVLLPSASDMTAVRVTTLETVRAEDPFSVNRIELAEDEALVLDDQLVDPEAERVRITLRTPEGAVTEQRILKSSGDTIDLALGHLAVGRYLLSLECAASEKDFALFSEFGFEIRRP